MDVATAPAETLSSEGDFHGRQRRMMAPALVHRQIASFATEAMRPHPPAFVVARRATRDVVVRGHRRRRRSRRRAQPSAGPPRATRRGVRTTTLLQVFEASTLAALVALAGCTVAPDGTAAVAEAAVGVEDAARAGAVCGGVAALACGDGLFCLFPHGTCGMGDTTGNCAARPEMCLDIYKPVCGCDGHDYPSPCEAHRAGMSVARRGRCKKPGEEPAGAASSPE